MIMKATLYTAHVIVKPLAVTRLPILTFMPPIRIALAIPINIVAREILFQVTKIVPASQDLINAVHVNASQLEIANASLKNSVALDKHGKIMTYVILAIEPKNAAVVILLLLMKTVTVRKNIAALQVGIIGEPMRTARATQELIAVFSNLLQTPTKQIQEIVAIQMNTAAWEIHTLRTNSVLAIQAKGAANLMNGQKTNFVLAFLNLRAAKATFGRLTYIALVIQQ